MQIDRSKFFALTTAMTAAVVGAMAGTAGCSSTKTDGADASTSPDSGGGGGGGGNDSGSGGDAASVLATPRQRGAKAGQGPSRAGRADVSSGPAAPHRYGHDRARPCPSRAHAAAPAP